MNKIFNASFSADEHLVEMLNNRIKQLEACLDFYERSSSHNYIITEEPKILSHNYHSHVLKLNCSVQAEITCGMPFHIIVKNQNKDIMFSYYVDRYLPNELKKEILIDMHKKLIRELYK